MGFKIVVSGADSDIAKRFLTLCEERPWVISCAERDFDTDTVGSVMSYFKYVQPSLFVNLATDFLDGKSQNLDKTRHLVMGCKETQTPLIQLASYTTVAESDVDETDRESRVEELNVHQQCIKENEHSEAEQLLRDTHKHLLLRCSWVLNGGATAVLPRLIPALLGNKGTIVSDHYFGYPISTSYIADTMIAIIQQVLVGSENWGTYHIRSADKCSEAEFCDHLVRQLQKELGIEVKFPDVANQLDDRRFFSGNAQLKGRSVTDDFGIQQPTWRRGFTRLLREWLQENNYHAEPDNTASSKANSVN